MEMKTLFKPDQLRLYFLTLLALCISLLLFRLIDNFLMALLVAGIFAGLAHPLYLRILERFGGRKGAASAMMVLLTLSLIIVPMLILTSLLFDQTHEISRSAGVWIRNFNEHGGLQETLQDMPVLSKLLPYQDKIIARTSELISKGSGFVSGALAAGAKSTASFLMSLFVMLYAMYFFLPRGGNWLRRILSYTPLLPEDTQVLLDTFISVARASIKGTLIIGIIQGGLGGLAFWLAGIQGALFWSAVMAVFSMLPVVGISIVWVPAVFYLAIKGQTGAAIAVGLWCAIIAGTVDNLLRPVLVGKETSMPDLLVLLTTLGGLVVFGGIGILIGPIIGALFIAIWNMWATAVDEQRMQKQD